MTYTRDTEIFLAPGESQDISENYWVKTLKDAGSFGVDALWAPFDMDERPNAARLLYRLVTKAGQRASYWLAKAFVEHSAGLNPDSVLWRGKTRSWGNATSVRLATVTDWDMYYDEKRGRYYVRYKNVIDSMKDALHRITDPTFVYVQEGRRTVAEVGARFVGLSENTDTYIDAIVTKMNRFVTESNAMSQPWAPPEITRRILPWKASNTPGQLIWGGTWDWITVHNTGNTNATATALMHAMWMESLAATGKSEPSWHYTVDENQIIQHLEDDWAAYHASDGNGPGNFDSLGIELCEIGDQQRVIRNAAWLIAKKLHARGKRTEWVRQHHDWARDKKNCPRLLRANGGEGWRKLLGYVEEELLILGGPPEPVVVIPPAQPDPWGTAFWIANVFVEEIKKHDWMLTGYAISEGMAEGNLFVQYFERARLELHPGGVVMRGHVGTEAMKAKHPERG